MERARRAKDPFYFGDPVLFNLIECLDSGLYKATFGRAHKSNIHILSLLLSCVCLCVYMRVLLDSPAGQIDTSQRTRSFTHTYLICKYTYIHTIYMPISLLHRWKSSNHCTCKIHTHTLHFYSIAKRNEGTQQQQQQPSSL